MADRQATISDARKTACQIVAALKQAGHVAYFAGGCVRDELLGFEPADYDIATDAVPERVCSLFENTVQVGAAFGVVLVRLNRVSIEVATFRSDGSYSDSRRPDSVRFSDEVSDARRRDFTINGLYLDPSAGDVNQLVDGGVEGGGGGQVIDHVGGVADLQARLVRAVGKAEDRLGEDHLRALRGVRLSARLGFEIESETARAIRDHASELVGVSRERIGTEIRRMLEHESCVKAISRIEGLGLDEPVLNEVHQESQLKHLSEVADKDQVGLKLAGWALDRHVLDGEASLVELSGRWRSALCLSNADRDTLVSTLRIHAALRDEASWLEWPVAQQKRLASDSLFRDVVKLIRVTNSALAGRICECYRSLCSMRSGLCPEPWVTGGDLMGFGLESGPRFSQVLEEVYDAQLEERVADRAQALELVKQLCVKDDDSQ